MSAQDELDFEDELLEGENLPPPTIPELKGWFWEVVEEWSRSGWTDEAVAFAKRLLADRSAVEGWLETYANAYDRGDDDSLPDDEFGDLLRKFSPASTRRLVDSGGKFSCRLSSLLDGLGGRSGVRSYFC